MLIDMIDAKIHELILKISEENKIKLLASGSLPDHMHLLIGLKTDQDLSWAVKMLKGISSRRLFLEFPLLKLDFKINNLWARRYGAKEVAKEALSETKQYILDQKKDLHIV